VCASTGISVAIASIIVLADSGAPTTT